MSAMKLFIIQGTWMEGNNYFKQYLEVKNGTTQFELIQSPSKATKFRSSVLAQGWLLKAQSLYPQFRFRVIDV